ncbi:hypothetical protein JCGZ_11159 [Jatropha curcas]|uniref:Uncharacterized protein n=1 Tax=Jatropha curcas TaxID=180498 RepID=A0A067LHH1_JATCU|nr:hypothetical protein JCGZ_11159 [Jatropha curcas]
MPCPCTSTCPCWTQGKSSGDSNSSTPKSCYMARPCQTRTSTQRRACLSTPVLHFILETQSLAHLTRALGHARATDSSLDVPLSTTRAEPSLELKL